jgi:hypothetical protein
MTWLPDPGAVTPDAQARITARAARARRRRWQRVGWVSLGVLWIAGVCTALLLMSNWVNQRVHDTAGPMVLRDDLSSNSNYWPEGAGCMFRDGTYHVAPRDPKYGMVCFAPTGRYRNFDMSVNAQVSSGPASSDFGMVFRAVDSGNGYLFAITASGTAYLGSVTQGQVSPLSPLWQYTASHSVGTAPITLRVVASGSSITCFVDGQRVGAVSDGTYGIGGIGVYAGPGGLDVGFSHLVLKTI